VRLAYFCFCGLRRFYHIDPNRDALLRFNLIDRNGAISAVEHPLNQTALRIPRTISKLWHRRGKIAGNLESQTGIRFASEQNNVLTNYELRRLTHDVARQTNHQPPRKNFYLSMLSESDKTADHEMSTSDHGPFHCVRFASVRSLTTAHSGESDAAIWH
jgi:hypothetical protein